MTHIGDITVSFALLESVIQSFVGSMIKEHQRIGQVISDAHVICKKGNLNMKPLIKPREEIEKAKLAIEDMKKAQNLNELEEAWKKYLGHLERVWNKSCSHLKNSPKFQGWTEQGRMNTLRRSDPLLSYLRNARGAEEHTIEDIVKKESGKIGINPAKGNSLHIESMEINEGNIKVKSAQPLKIEFIPEKMTLIPVINRGVKHDVPQKHMGKDLKQPDPIHFAELGLAFYENYIETAEKFFVK